MFVGNINDLEAMFARTEANKVLFAYLKESSQKNSEIYKRILDLKIIDKNRVEKSYDLGFGMRAIEQSYDLSWNNYVFESHRKFVDFQLVIYGNEIMECGDEREFSAINEYSNKTDCINFEKKLNSNINLIHLSPQTLAIFFPSDIHGVGYGNGRVYKTVVKVPVENLSFRL